MSVRSSEWKTSKGETRSAWILEHDLDHRTVRTLGNIAHRIFSATCRR
jgi:hypothetical protein